MKIPFNKPHFTGREAYHLSEAAILGHLAGNGRYTQLCQGFLEERYGFRKALLTTSCTDALELAALILGIVPGDEVIMPSYTFVSTANAFALRGAKIVFADSNPLNPNIDAGTLAGLINEKTRAIVAVHYGGIACDMQAIMALAAKHRLFVVEDAAQCVDAFYNDLPLGSFGHLAAFSFHETKNITSGEGGMLVVNDASLIERAEIAREKGTNRTAFSRGEVEKYEWVSLGSSFLPNELTAAFLYGQLEHLDIIQQNRMEIWQRYRNLLSPLEEKGYIGLPYVPDYAAHNAHLFYITTGSQAERDHLLNHLTGLGIHAVFHYLSLHSSPYFSNKHDGRELPYAGRYASTLIRLPLFFGLDENETGYIVAGIKSFFEK
ncbi:dTDP-4-amino-4,6-dideoxygalactose transaminase [bioreactor metagenome]|jgi:dTDP-4-amino-4,6-dideoxygalactose transaminase|uniref:dTDP-4-amino-4,6-dideoxygalactose transaminase n=1 Tax=bioreactor metagenome TaxID=1076179 RepID=A0A644VI36_9ZZZZ|nr:dTDP-4-amino-4,6-dideoxygalactose transaminase [Lentimicrobium sp.]MEA5110612.1 dTDP-4-amino-4,6-dideoxygalactose transaminase [Lentimicrobium sp.]